jgi:hypothetical protein
LRKSPWRRWLGAAILVVPAIALAVFVATSRAPKLHAEAPALAKAVMGAHVSLAQLHDPDAALGAYLMTQFPPGTPAAAMRAALERQGFVRNPETLRCAPRAGRGPACWKPPHPGQRLTYGWGRDDCKEIVDVRWNEDARGRLRGISAQYAAVCIP